MCNSMIIDPSGASRYFCQALKPCGHRNSKTLTKLLHHKFYGIVLACKSATARSFAHWLILGIPVEQPNFCRWDVVTRQIWGIWKLRPAYSPETPNLGQNRWCFVPCDLEIWWMTLVNNRAPLFCCFKLCATFHSHRWIQTGVAVWKRPIWVKFYDF